jgi:hypothetical protein
MRIALIVAATATGGFIWFTGRALPPMVASHFAASGAANGFMPRGAYLGVMLVIAVGVPAAVALLSGYALTRPGARINLPNREHWLAPERRGQTIAFLQGQIALFSMALMAFLAFGHYLVVRANLSPSLTLPPGWMALGVALLLACLAAIIISIPLRFRRPPG